MHKFRASSLGRIMSDAQSIDPALLDDTTRVIAAKKTKTEEDKAILAPLKERSLSAGAKTFVEELAKELVYGFDVEISSKYLTKGLTVEDQAIALYNEVTFANCQKNKDRLSNEWITGEADLVLPNKITDIKSSWSLQTFPVMASQGRDADYEWQGRAYMWLWDKPEFELAYCLVNTPAELIGYEDESLHYVDHIDPVMRVTTVRYLRDITLESRIKVKCEAANSYLQQVVRQIAQEHSA